MSSLMLLFLFKALLKFLVFGFVLVGSHSILRFSMLVIMVSLMKAVDSSISMPLEFVTVESVVKDISTVNFVISMVDLVITFMGVESSVSCSWMVVLMLE